MTAVQKAWPSVHGGSKWNRLKIIFDGKWVDAKSGETFTSINPANKDEVIGIISKSGREDVDEAVKAAREAYEDVAADAGATEGGNPVQGCRNPF